MITKPYFLLWYTFAASVSPVHDYFHFVVLFMSFTIFPLLIAVAVLLVVPLVALGIGIVRLVKRDFGAALQYFAVPFVGYAAIFVGQFAGDVIVAQTAGRWILSEIEAARSGEPKSAIRFLFISAGEPQLAFFLNGGFLDLQQGIAYDESDSLVQIMRLRPSERPRWWQAQAVDVLSCRGGARHMWGHFYMVYVSTWDCDE